MVALHDIRPSGLDHEGRKVRAPQGRVVRNADCPMGRRLQLLHRVRIVPQKKYRPMKRLKWPLHRVRVKRRGKSSPVPRATGVAW